MKLWSIYAGILNYVGVYLSRVLLFVEIPLLSLNRLNIPFLLVFYPSPKGWATLRNYPGVIFLELLPFECWLYTYNGWADPFLALTVFPGEIIGVKASYLPKGE